MPYKMNFLHRKQTPTRPVSSPECANLVGLSIIEAQKFADDCANEILFEFVGNSFVGHPSRKPRYFASIEYGVVAYARYH